MQLFFASVIIIPAAFIFTDILFPFRPKLEYSQVILDKDDQILHAFLTKDQKWRMRCKLEDINPVLTGIIQLKEDKWYRYHPGVNPFAIVRASWQNITRQKRVSGASTITMQLARLLEHRDRTYFNKGIEIFHAFQLEWHYSKDEILEMYLNLLPYGGNIEGIRAASMLYFGQSPQALSLAQMATLAIIPNNPHHLRMGKHNTRIRDERNGWLARWAVKGFFSQDDYISALQEPLLIKRLSAPRDIPHYAIELRRLYEEETELHTSIDQNLQDEAGNILESEIQKLRINGITNGAVIILNNRTHSIEAYLGSAGFDENQYLGQVNGCRALRSPGSALKPFLYLMAIDMGLITPRSLVNDIPLNFNGYRPQNYDETFRGQLPVSQALALSLNIPAVDLANQVGVDAFISKLSRGGLKWVEGHKRKLGLAVVLGGCGVTLTELTSLYSSLANQGVHYPIQMLKNQKPSIPDTLFSPEATWMVTEMLTNLKRPDLPGYFENSIHLPHIAWKTGTSYGRRDAWSVGYNPDFTVGVWIGNFDGTGVPELSGSECAVPVLFRIFNLLCQDKQCGWFSQPKGIDFRLICSESGMPPNDFCENLVMDYYIPSVSKNRKCNHLVEVFTNPPGSISYCRNCLPAEGYISQFFPNFQPSLISYYQDQQIPYRKIPPHNPDCQHLSKSASPRITSLTDGKEYLMYAASGQQLQLACDASADVSKVYWYINDTYFKTCSASEKVFFTPLEGQTKISCCDDKGRNTDILIRVRFI